MSSQVANVPGTTVDVDGGQDTIVADATAAHPSGAVQCELPPRADGTTPCSDLKRSVWERHVEAVCPVSNVRKRTLWTRCTSLASSQGALALLSFIVVAAVLAWVKPPFVLARQQDELHTGYVDARRLVAVAAITAGVVLLVPYLIRNPA